MVITRSSHLTSVFNFIFSLAMAHFNFLFPRFCVALGVKVGKVPIISWVTFYVSLPLKPLISLTIFFRIKKPFYYKNQKWKNTKTNTGLSISFKIAHYTMCIYMNDCQASCLVSPLRSSSGFCLSVWRVLPCDLRVPYHPVKLLLYSNWH